MASKVLVPGSPFTKLQVQKSPEPPPPARVAHLEHSVRFLQEQHRAMLAGLHAEIEALRERNRDLQFQLIFNKESVPRPTLAEESSENNEEVRLQRALAAAERAAAAARGEARAAEARGRQLQQLVDAQAEKIRTLSLSPACGCGAEESRPALRARLDDAERLVRRLRADAERQRRELQCMKNSLQTSLRVSSLEPGFGFHNSYHFPPLQSSDFWREPLREDYNLLGARGRSGRRPLTLPELSATGHQMHRSTIYANHHTRPRAGFEGKKKSPPVNNENISVKSLEDPSVSAAPVDSRRRRRKHAADNA